MSSLRHKIVRIGVAPVAALAAVLLVALVAVRFTVAWRVQREVGGLVRSQLSRTTLDVRLLCEASDLALQEQLDRNLRVLGEVVARNGGLAPAAEKVAWRAVDQADGSVRELELPKLFVGRSWLGADPDPAHATPAIDEAQRLIGGAVTIFQRMDERGDMLRVATTVAGADGRRAIGTFIPAVAGDGTPNPVIEAVLRGQGYRGRARVVDSWYVAAYEPIRDAAGAIVGMMFAGVRQDGLDHVRRAVLEMRPGATGDVVAIGGTGKDRGVYSVSAGGKHDGVSIWEARDDRGRLFVQDVVARAVALAPGETGIVEYAFRRPDGQVVDRVAAFTYYAPWDWVVLAGIDRKEAEAAAGQVKASLLLALALLVLVAGGALALAVRGARRTAARISAPVEEMAAAAERLAEGDLSLTIEHRSDDEVGRLADAFRGTLGYVRDVADAAAAMAQGDLAHGLRPRSDRDVLTRRFQEAQAALRQVLDQIGRVSRAAMDGRLSERAALTGVGTYARCCVA